MAQCIHIELDGTHYTWPMTVENGVDDCGDYYLLERSEYYDLTHGLASIPDFATYGITPETVTEVAAWGFAAVIAGWALGLVTGWVAEAIRRA